MIRKETLKSIQSKLKKIGLEEMKARVGKKFFDMNGVVEALYYAIISGKNIILYGPGGFGKTEITLEFIKQAGLEHSVIVGYEDMDVEGLLGLPNMTKMMEESVYEIAFEKTVFNNPGVLILEEFLDVNPKTAIALKDILTAGGYRQGNKFIPSAVSSVIICSNKSPYELSVDNSTAALYKERFPFIVSVGWIEFSTTRYMGFIRKVVGEKKYEAYKQVYDVLAELAHRTSKTKEVVSPRIVKDAIDILEINNFNLQSINKVDGLDTSVLGEVLLYCSNKDEESRTLIIIANVKEYLRELMETPSSTRFIIDSIAEINYIIKNLKGLHVNTESSLQMISNCTTKCEDVLNNLWSKIDMKSIKQPTGKLDQLFSPW